MEDDLESKVDAFKEITRRSHGSQNPIERQEHIPDLMKAHKAALAAGATETELKITAARIALEEAKKSGNKAKAEEAERNLLEAHNIVETAKKN